jgi:hypothetical protein
MSVPPPRPRPAQSPFHDRLLERPPDATRPSRIDGIVVPASRHGSQLQPAMALAAGLGCPLLVLCSHQAVAADVRAAGREAGTTVYPVDMRTVHTLPGLLTTALLADTPFRYRRDTPAKRNLGLAVAHMAGWQRILALDDDIHDLGVDTVERAATLLDQYDVVGMDNVGFPDNSVVCHAIRDTGGEQGTFIGSGAMLYPGARTASFFPEVYNEDWFFLLDSAELAKCAVSGKFAQAKFDPYANPTRAGAEEFGDCLAEGVFALLEAGLTTADGDHAFWAMFLADRARIIEDLLQRLPRRDLSAFRRQQIAAALRAARASLDLITPTLCFNYLAAWRRDRDIWREWVGSLPRGRTVDEALAHLGIPSGSPPVQGEDQVRDQGGPAGLVPGAEASTVVPVEVLREGDEVPPVGMVLELL